MRNRRKGRGGDKLGNRTSRRHRRWSGLLSIFTAGPLTASLLRLRNFLVPTLEPEPENYKSFRRNKS